MHWFLFLFLVVAVVGSIALFVKATYFYPHTSSATTGAAEAIKHRAPNLSDADIAGIVNENREFQAKLDAKSKELEKESWRAIIITICCGLFAGVFIFIIIPQVWKSLKQRNEAASKK